MKKVSRRDFLAQGLGYAAAMTAATTASLPGRPARAAGQPTVLKLGHADTALHPAQAIATRFGDLVKERTGGSIEVRVFPVGQLGTMANVMSGLTTGIVDLCMTASGFLESFFPRIQALDLPFLFKDAGPAERLLDGPIGQELLKDMSVKGIYGLTWGHYGWRLTETARHSLKVPADFKGLKIRVQPGAVFAAMFKAVGAIPVVVDLSELYLALSQGTVNGYELPFLAVISSKLVEVTKYIGLTNHVYNAGALMASQVRLDALTPKEQEVIRETAKEIQPFWRKTIAEKSLEDRKTCEQRGLTITEIDYPAFQ
ncbi:MAG TPA: TRAP transporter substrate-binding protein, partial [Candidatus Sulfotelmatobacter sp.]|nr:TRAP transporter substrate-binding protein [Candidatus Sulfotelmatobacter sp.]